MTKKDYIILAKVIYQAKIQELSIAELAENMADELKQDNPNFNRNRFLEICGLTQ
jgi:hypothetical protein